MIVRNNSFQVMLTCYQKLNFFASLKMLLLSNSKSKIAITVNLLHPRFRSSQEVPWWSWGSNASQGIADVLGVLVRTFPRWQLIRLPHKNFCLKAKLQFLWYSIKKAFIYIWLTWTFTIFTKQLFFQKKSLKHSIKTL